MANTPNDIAFWNPGQKLGVLVLVGLLVGLKSIDSLVQEGGILSSSWKWTLTVSLGALVMASVAYAYRRGVNDERDRAGVE